MFGFFKKKSALDIIDESVLVTYQRFTDENLTEQELLEVVQTTMRAFRQASTTKNEHISANILMNISAFMVMFRAHKTKKEWLTHLNNEINFYLENNIRNSYINGPMNNVFRR